MLSRAGGFSRILLCGLFTFIGAAVGHGGPEPTGWYSGDMHVHRSCGGEPIPVSTIYNEMVARNLSVVSLLADMGNGEVQNPVTDLPLVTGQDDSNSTPGRIIHWDAEWHWDATYTGYPHQALGGHLVALGLTNAQQMWREYTFPILEWVRQQGGIVGFAHMQYLPTDFPDTNLGCCAPIEYPVEVALGSCDFISEDVAGGDATMRAYYRLLNCGFRPGFAGGSDHPCNAQVGSVITYVQTPGSLTYSNWIQGIKAGRTVVSRTGHNQFLQLTANGGSTPGDEIQMTTPGSVPVTVQWTATEDLTNKTIQLVHNGVVVASKVASVVAGDTNTLSTVVDFTDSGWLCARTMGDAGHELHTAAVFVKVNNREVRASVADARFYIEWMDNLLLNTASDGVWGTYFQTNRVEAQARYQAAKTVFQNIAAEAAMTSPYGAGPGGSILVVTNATHPFSAYYAEILLNEGLNQFALRDASAILPATLDEYEVVLLGETALTSGQVTTLSNWVSAGGNLIAMRPDKQLAGLLGLDDAAATTTNRYLLVNTHSGPGVGIVDESIQFHGAADLYTADLSTATVALLYSDASSAMTNPAVTLRSVGTNGGQAAAFTFDLAQSVVLTRQGNPAWVDQNRDGDLLVRSDDLFYGAAGFDPQPNWVDLNKITIPQADEQQRLLANLIVQMSADRKRLPRFWYFPDGHKAVVVMTGDDHANGGNIERFDQLLAMSQPGGSVDDWESIRASSYMYTGTAVSDAQAAGYQAAGFELGFHLNTGCANYTPAQLTNFFTTQLDQWMVNFPSLGVPNTLRTHCIAWSGYTLMPEVGRAFGIRMDTSYYHYPPFWLGDRPGFLTGSGMPMRFARADGTVIDVFQAATQLTDESGQSYPATIDMLLDKALGPEQFFGAFVANMHTDVNPSPDSDAIIMAATNRAVPVITSRQLLTWLDARNSSRIGDVAYSNSTATFSITASLNARGLQVMMPVPVGEMVNQVRRDSVVIAHSNRWVKGIRYACFPGLTGDYEVDYASDSTPPAVAGVTPHNGAVDVDVNATVMVMFSRPMNAATIDTNTLTVRGPGNVLVPASVVYNPSTFAITAVLSPASPLEASTVYTVTVAGGAGGVKDSGGVGMAGDFTSSFTVAPTATYNLWTEMAAPLVASFDGDTNGAIELGVKFRSAVAGYVTGIKFYKGTGNTGTHVGNLWTAEGIRLSSVVFSNETAGGWQYQQLPSPVPITSNTTFVASYFAPSNHYSVDVGYFSVLGHTNYPLWGLRNGEDGGNGVYRYSPTSTFPTDSANGDNWWVDVEFVETLGPDTNGPVVWSVTPTNTAVGVGRNPGIRVIFNEAMDEATLTNNIVLSNALSGLVPVKVTYFGLTNTAVLTPTGLLAVSTEYTVLVAGGTNGVKDAAGNALTNDFASSFTTTDQSSLSLWNEFTGAPDSGDSDSVELGLKFQSAMAGYVTGIRFYKSPANTGTHTGTLWLSGGTPLSSVTFSNETASGWQFQALTNPVVISSNTTYVVSYYAPSGHYAFTPGAFVSAVTNYPLRALSSGEAGGNGVYRTGTGFPTLSFNAANYWVDLVFEELEPDTNAPVVLSVNPANDAEGVSVHTSVRVMFNEAMDAASLTNGIVLSNAVTGVLPGTLAYYGATNTAIFTPSNSLALSAEYTIVVKGGTNGVKDAAGNSLTNNLVASFTTTNQMYYSIWPDTAIPTQPSYFDPQDPNPYELGTKFRSATNGYVMGIRFYKGTGNQGPHTGTLWSSNGTALSSVTFSNETASGWQYQPLTNPVPISANVTYVVSYHSPDGHYAVDTTSDPQNLLGGVNHPPLRALAHNEDGPNGVYVTNNAIVFPTNGVGANYWVDVVFVPPVVQVAAIAQSKTYGGNDPELTYTASGFLPGDSAQTVLSGSLTRAPGESVGNYPITQGTLVAAGTYSIHFTASALAINPRPLTVTATDTNKVRGTVHTFLGTEFTLNPSLVNADTLTNVTLTSAGAPADAAVGLYDIIASAAQGVGLTNYQISYANGTLTVVTDDTDGDGIPDAYELAHGLNPTNSTDATIDADGDRFTNLEEYRSGTDLNNSSSALRIVALEVAGTNMSISFSSVAGKVYRVERNNQFPSGSWTTVAENIAGNGGVINMLDLGGNAATQGVYRVSVTNVVSEPSGFCKLTLLGNSDTIVSLPFTRTEVAAGLVETVAGSQIQVKGAPAWVANQFVYAAGVQSNTYYLLIRSGTMAGRSFTITNNTSNTVTLDLNGGSLVGVVSNDLVSIVPCWTLATVFPGSNGIYASPSPLSRSTEILMPDLNGSGINLSVSKIYFFHAGIWKQVGQGAASRNDDVLPPNAYFIVRHNMAGNTVCTPVGAVVTSMLAIPLKVSAVGRQDNFVALARPAPVSLDGSGLTNGGAFMVSPSALSRRDELLVFDNTVTNKNKSASAIYYYLSSGWRQVGSALPAGSQEVFTPGSAVIIRKFTNSIAPVWINSPAY